MAWRAAKSLLKLKAQIDALAPNRSRATDGLIGDEAHSARKSDHNPNAAGVVCAMDITHDPAGGVDCNELAAALVGSRDPRIKYVIWDRRISNPDVQAWAWRRYDGTNPHTVHLHISVKAALADGDSPWLLTAMARPPAPVPRPEPSMTDPPFAMPPDFEAPVPKPEPKRGGCAEFFRIIRGIKRGT